MGNKPREVKITWEQFKKWKEEDIQKAIGEGVNLGCGRVDDFTVFGVQQGIKMTFTFGIFRKREQIKEADEKCDSLLAEDRDRRQESEDSHEQT